MRALVTEPSVVPPDLYRRFLQTTQVEALFPDGLVRGEPYLALNALVLAEHDVAQLRRLTGVFSAALGRAARRLATDVPALIELGFPWVAAELLAAEAPRVPIVGRFDFVCDGEGHWWLLEFNADTPSGVREAIVADRLVWRTLADHLQRLDPEVSASSGSSLAAGPARRPNRGLRAALVRAVLGAVGDVEPGSAVGLVTTAGELEDLAQMAFTRNLVQKPLGDRGLSVVLGDVDNLEATPHGLRLLGHRLGALYRYVPFESLLGSRAFAAIGEAAARGRPRILNGLHGLLLQNKGLLAWVWEHRDDPLFEPEERAAIHAHLPPTWMVGDVPSGLSLPSLVVKQLFGREGEEVYFGEDLIPAEWDNLRGRRTYVAQKRVAVTPILAALPSSLGSEAREVRASVGCFAVAGKWAGFYSRLGGKVITSQAKWVATFMASS